ncbi:MAG: asparagine synthase (glutamine-hydrolyzing) [Phycisphaeraceae bacterium]|nr:asparagine synthase (glutamine-hydrolyzing) [Phycisphaeraceae bacterium]
MCGVAGIVRFLPADAPPGPDIEDAWLDALDAGIRHRGPDGQGRFRDHATTADGSRVHVALVHRRLSIIDHAGGGQPMVVRGDRGDRVAVAFNGCIYNHRPLRAELQARGHAFGTDHSDTEALAIGVRAWGERVAERLDGMYAVAAWDSRHARLLLMRDPAGEKPLYLAPLGPGTLAFASTVPALVGCMRRAGAEVRIDGVGIAMWLKHGSWDRLPLNVLEAQPGGVYVIASAAETRAPIPRVLVRPFEPSDGRIAPAEVRRALEEAVESRLEADVPLGCFLSGGVDSSVVAALAQRSLRERGQRLRTFHVRMPDADFDEAAYADLVAQHIGSDHAELPCEASAADDLRALIAQMGLPFGDSSLLPTTWVNRAARREVAVALGGDGGDELFGGYDRYRAADLLRAHPVARRALALAGSVVGPLLRGRAERAAAAARWRGYFDVLSIFTTPSMHALLGRGEAERLMTAGYAGVAEPRDPRREDFGRYLPQDLMRKVDTASMHAPLEARSPLLARRLVRLVLAADRHAVAPNGVPKGLLRSIARELVPARAVDRRKMGFAVPLGRWLRSDFGALRSLMRDALGAPGAFDTLGLPIDRATVARWMDEHDRGSHDHGQRLYALTTAALWARWLTRT